MADGLGTMVEYRDSMNRRKAALVLATYSTIDGTDQSGVHAPGPGRAHLLVFGFTGSQYVKYDVPSGDGSSTFTLPEGQEGVFGVLEAPAEHDAVVTE